MRSWRFHDFGNLANLQLGEAPVPTPAADEALVRLEFAALNPADRYLIEGMYPRPGKPPFAVGRDGSGVIEQAPEGSELKAGDKVVVLRSDIGVKRGGTLAEFVAVPVASLARLPEGWSMEEGAAAPLVYLTAWQALVDTCRMKEGETVLVTGASGGVGTASIQLAKALGAKRVVALSRSAEKGEALKRLGADDIVQTSEKFSKDVHKVLGGGRVDVVVENLAGPVLQQSLECVGWHGRIGVVGLLSGLTSEIQIAPMLFKRAMIQGVSVGDFTAEQSQEAWRGIVEAMSTAGVKPVIGEVFPFEEVQEAFARLKEGPLGKVLVKIR